MTLRIVIDTREQDPLEPYILAKGERTYLETVRRKLDFGDYALEGYESVICIERKSVADLYGTLFGAGTNAAGEAAPNQERFRAEMLRAKDCARRYVLVEGSWGDLEMWMYSAGRRKTIVEVNALVTSISLRYNVDFVWCEIGRREEAAYFVGTVLSWVYYDAIDPKVAKKQRDRGLELPWLRKAEQ